MKKTRSTRLSSLFVAAGAGAALMYFLDPQQGRRRAALVRDQWTRVTRTSRDTADAGVRDLAHRATGMAARLRGVFNRKPANDRVLVQRVRAEMGRWVSHPHAIEVVARDGSITLRGPILQTEEEPLLQAVLGVPGVREAKSELESHQTADKVPSLQGGRSRAQPRMEFLQENWAPGPRLATLAAGGALAALGIAQRGIRGTLLSVLGLGLVARGATNKSLGRLLGVAGGRRAVDVQKSIHIAAPRQHVFDVWSQVENFPHFMSRVRDVHPLDEQRSHWTVKGPAGADLEWNSVLTECVPPQRLAWRSEPGAPVQHAGTVRFDEDGQGTRVTVRLSYNPPGGAVGHAVATLLGHNPKHDMDADLMRMKSFIETGTAPRDAAQPEIHSTNKVTGVSK